MDDIAAAAGVTKPVLYRTIGDKEAFVGALSEVMVDAMRTAADVAVQSLADAPESDPPPEGIDLGREIFRAALHGCLVAIDRDRNLFAFVNAGGPGTASFRSLVDRSSVELVDQFAELRRNAGLDPAPSRTWAYAIVGAIQVVAMMWLRDEFRDLDAVADDLAGLMWPGVTSAPAR